MPDGIRGEEWGGRRKQRELGGGGTDDGGNKGENRKRAEEMDELGRDDRHPVKWSPRSLLSLGVHGRRKLGTVSARATEQRSNKVFQPETLRWRPNDCSSPSIPEPGLLRPVVAITFPVKNIKNSPEYAVRKKSIPPQMCPVAGH